jgi:hypothetical protein
MVLSIFLLGTAIANSQEENAFTREQAISYLNNSIGNATSFDFGAWIVGHVTGWKKGHQPMHIAGSDDYMFIVAKYPTEKVREYECSIVQALYKNRKAGFTNKLEAKICVNNGVVLLSTKAFLQGDGI